MPSPVITPINGYLEDAYLADEYLDGESLYAYGMQAAMFINAGAEETGMQANMVVTGALKATGMQAQMRIGSSLAKGQQALMKVTKSALYGMQANAVVSGADQATGMQARADTLRHAWCAEGGYLVQPYLTDPYLVLKICAEMGMQAKMIVKTQMATGQQAQMVIKSTKTTGMQAKMVVKADRHYGMQAQMLKSTRTGLQATLIIYNDTQLRILQLFTSRGTAALGGNNWTTNSQASGDFSVNNVNTDVEEQVYRSASKTGVEMISDTGVVQGVTIDTLAIRRHNLTRDATVQVQGSMSGSFGTINVTFDVPVELLHMYYIAPTFPTGSANQNRYWKLLISDPSNPNPYIEIGAVLFGNSQIVSVDESYENPLRQGKKHFSDKLPIEGYTTDQNDKALKKWLKLSFSQWERVKGNFRMVEAYTDFVRTSLKALIIPAPKYPSRYAVFAKLKQMPEFEHNNVSDIDDPDGRAEYMDFNLEWDEAD